MKILSKKEKRKQIYSTRLCVARPREKWKQISSLGIIMIGIGNEYCAHEYVIFSHNRKEVIASFALIQGNSFSYKYHTTFTMLKQVFGETFSL